MELDHFISGSRIESTFIKDKWLDTASLATRSFVATGTYGFTGISADDDFSLFFTFDKKNNSAGNLFSNFSSGLSRGYCVGFNNNNELFAQTFNSPFFAEKFYDIRLGKKNCLGIVKNNRSLTIYKYNLQGTGVSQQQTVLFPRTANLSGETCYFGYEPTLTTRNGLQGISGLFDQMVLFNTPLTKDQCLSVFSGFQPYNKSSSTTFSKIYETSGYDRRSGSFITETEIRDISPIFNSISDQIPNNFTNFVANFSGFLNGGLDFGVWTGVYATGNSLACYSTGSVSPNVFGTGTYNSTSNANYTFTDSIYSSMNNSGEKLISHFITLRSHPTGIPEDFFIYNLYQRYNTGVSHSLSLSGNYKTGFYMDGIVTNIPSGVTLLSNVSGDLFNQLGYEGIFDRTIGLFAVDDDLISGHRVYWGLSGKISGYSLESGYLNILNTAEDNTYPLFYDLGSGNVNFIHTTLLGYATGRFDPDTSIVFTGLNSWTQLFRSRKTEAWETSTYHLAHSKTKVLPTTYESIYPNTQDYWS